ncbi:MAG: RIP metalloprotease RseP [Rhodospirillaceae bacterium]|nr:RIP metalloprotease RseP [Rhodospirillaceae bacterium]
MELFSFIWEYVLPFVLVLSVLIFIHEMGHFLVARWAGVKVEVFSIGFGGELYGFNDRHGTRWRVSAVPLGGYVKMFGEGDIITGVDDTEDRPMTNEEKKISFHHKPLSKRTAIVAAGPAANFLFAIVLFAFMSSVLGLPKPYAVIGEVMDDSAAEESGFEIGDEITAVNDKSIQWFEELSQIVAVNANKSLVFSVNRGGKAISINATPRTVSMKEFGEKLGIEEEESDEKDNRERSGENSQQKMDATDDEHSSRGLLGVRPHPDFVEQIRKDPLTSIWIGVKQTYLISSRILGVVGEMLSGERSSKELGGVISIAQYSGEAVQNGAITILTFMAALSVNLGLINLFPVPMLDGGHLVYYIFEALRGRPLSQRIQEYGFRFGMILVFMLMIFATWNDFERILKQFGMS